MKEVIQEAVRLVETEEPAVLATVVRTKGSTPQKPGAKLLVRKDGTGVGTLGGGCVEGDIWYAAKEILRRKGGPEFKDYFLNEEIAARDGLVCGGTMYFFIEPLWEPGEFLPFGREIMGAYESGNPVSVAMVVKSDSGRGVAGAKLLLREDGSTQGALGDPGLDALALEAARRVADLGTNEHLMTDDGTELYVEGFTTPPTLVLMGGGHVAKATYDLALLLRYRIYVVDDRPEFANPERFPGAEDTVVVPDYARGLDQVPINANTFIVIATRGHWFDDLALEAAIRTPAKYVGLMGSTRKTILIYQRLAGLGIPVEKLRQVHAPIGLDIGALTPEEIAVSIMSEIVMFRHGASGGPMIMDDRYFDRAVGRAAAVEAAPD
ncbi:MAG: XdhC family protein [Dehalococcoidia bacterium]|nr:XdhC family protein [Dehalococcoidia bacterium]